MIKPVILAGGSGSRLWPLSRQCFPKQFLSLIGKNSLLQQTVERLKPIVTDDLVFITNEEQRFLLAEQLRQVGLNSSKIFLEPVGRNTAPAIAVAALSALDEDPDSTILVLASDHLIKNNESFYDSVEKASVLARNGKLVTFGIVPTGPETGYGYIKRGESLGDFGYSVEKFVEKPGFDAAKSYISEGHYYWNSGMFLFKASRYIEELEKYSPEIVKACRLALSNASKDLDFIRLESNGFSSSPSVSIDYALMEHTEHACVVPLNSGWSDIGSWSALWDVAEKDQDGNVTYGDVMIYDGRDQFVHADNRLVATVGVSDLVVVETKDAVLVANKNRVQDVKNIVEELKKRGRTEHESHREVYRPWGVYDSISSGDRYQVKKITVKPGAKLSVQMHHHRAEHWVVVSGTAKVTNGEKTYLVGENESTYIPVGCVHALENPGVIPLELVEVQSGAYLGEDDIVRFDDRYGRS